MNEGTGTGAGTAGSQTLGAIFSCQAGKAPVGVITPREKTNLVIFSHRGVRNKQLGSFLLENWIWIQGKYPMGFQIPIPTSQPPGAPPWILQGEGRVPPKKGGVQRGLRCFWALTCGVHP